MPLAAIQTKQLLKQKIREAEKETLYNEYIDKIYLKNLTKH